MSETDNESHNGDDSLRPRKRSLVWQFFEKLSRYRVRCRLCAHEQNYQGTTGNILRHLKSKHELDATIKGQQDPHHQERLRLLLSNVSAYSSSNSNNNTNTFSTMDIKVERKYKPRKRSHNDMMTQEDDDNPFVDDGGHNNSTTYIQEEVCYYICCCLYVFAPMLLSIFVAF